MNGTGVMAPGSHRIAKMLLSVVCMALLAWIKFPLDPADAVPFICVPVFVWNIYGFAFGQAMYARGRLEADDASTRGLRAMLFVFCCVLLYLTFALPWDGVR